MNDLSNEQASDVPNWYIRKANQTANKRLLHRIISGAALSVFHAGPTFALENRERNGSRMYVHLQMHTWRACIAPRRRRET